MFLPKLIFFLTHTFSTHLNRFFLPTKSFFFSKIGRRGACYACRSSNRIAASRSAPPRLRLRNMSAMAWFRQTSSASSAWLPPHAGPRWLASCTGTALVEVAAEFSTWVWALDGRPPPPPAVAASSHHRKISHICLLHSLPLPLLCIVCREDGVAYLAVQARALAPWIPMKLLDDDG